LEGVGGGIAKPSGRGIALFPTRASTDGSEVIVFDETVLIKKASKLDSSVRILSAQKLRAGGLRTVQGEREEDPGFLEHRDAGIVARLVERQGILVLDTINKRAANYKANRQVLAAIEMWRMGNGPPFVVLDSPRHRKRGGGESFRIGAQPMARAVAEKGVSERSNNGLLGAERER
jgi:hypothetical protein